MIPHQLPLMADLQFADPRLPAHFWRKIRMDADSGCWLWIGAVTSSGYGSWGVNGRVESTHRVTYEAFRGPIRRGYAVDHLCEIRTCCNPAHLEAVTQGENNRRAVADQTHCKHGHPLSGDNLHMHPRGQRVCIQCRREHSRRYRRRLAAAASP